MTATSPFTRRRIAATGIFTGAAVVCGVAIVATWQGIVLFVAVSLGG